MRTVHVDDERLIEHMSKDTRPFAPMHEALDEVGIPRSNRYELVRRGLLETFRIGRIRYVILESVRRLPEHAGPDGNISLKPDRDAA